MIRVMNSNDVKGVHRLEVECFNHPWSLSAIEKEVNNDNSLFCVYEVNGEIVGYAGMYYICDEGDITNVAVTKEYRGKGIGKQLLTEMFRIANKNGKKEFTLEVRESNVIAKHLYESIGFKKEGIRKNFYDNPTEDGVIMWKRQ
jgi:ribosomal-protein-alanine N-acetyltransferase